MAIYFDLLNILELGNTNIIVKYKNAIKFLVSLVAGFSTTIGQSLLVNFLFPAVFMGYSPWIVISLLGFNCGAAILVIFSS
jgi:hypothetical protein